MKKSLCFPLALVVSTLTLCAQDASPAPGATASASPISALTPGAPIPKETLTDLNAKLLSSEEETQLSLNSKVHRLNAALRAAEQIEQDNPNAPNLYAVRSAILEIARQLAMVEGDVDSQLHVMDLAKRIVSLPGPPEAKIWADYLVTQSRVAQLGDDTAKASAEVEAFVGRFENSRVAPIALMSAVDMATKIGDTRYLSVLMPQLIKYREEPAVEAFLRDRAARVFVGYSLNATLATTDGKTVSLPRDRLGKVTVLHFWSTSSDDMAFMRSLYDQYHSQGLEIIGINLDQDRKQFEDFVRAQGIAWPQVFTGLGVDDPLFKRLSIPKIPYYWVIGWDGRITVANPTAGAASMGDRSLETMANSVKSEIETARDVRESLLYYRSGEFLLGTPLLRAASGLQTASGQQKEAIPAKDLEAIEAKLTAPRADGASPGQKTAAFKEALAAAEALEKGHESAPNAALVRSWMIIAAKWLAIATGTKSYDDEALAIAQRSLEASPAGASRYLADYIVTSTQIAALEPRTKEGAQLIQDFVSRNEGSDISWAADILGCMLTYEDGQDMLRDQLAENLSSRFLHRPASFAYQFLRDCGEKFDEGGQEGATVNGKTRLGSPSRDDSTVLAGEYSSLPTAAARLEFCRSGEFLLHMLNLRFPDANPQDSIPDEELDVLRQDLMVPQPKDVTKAQKAQSYKDLIAAGEKLEQSYPVAAELELVRAWMLIAERWLAIDTGDKASAEKAAALANQLLAGNTADRARLLADYAAVSAQLAATAKGSGAQLIQDFATRNASADDEWLVRVLTILLTYDNGQDAARKQMAEQFKSAYSNRPGTIVYGFLRDCYGDHFDGSQELTLPPCKLTRMDGRPLSLPDEMQGKIVVLQFWSTDHPPEPSCFAYYDTPRIAYNGVASVPATGVEVIGINMDRNRAAAGAFLKSHHYGDWIHTFSGAGFNDPLARACDVLSLPRAIVLDGHGQIAYTNESRFMGQSEQGTQFNREVLSLVHQIAKDRAKASASISPSPSPGVSPAAIAAASPPQAGEPKGKNETQPRQRKSDLLGNSLNVSFTPHDSSPLRFPRDLLGKVTLLHFWLATSALKDSGDVPIPVANDIPHMRVLYDRYHSQGVDLIGINAGQDCGTAMDFIHQQDLAWPQVCTGKGMDDPLFQQLDVTQVPAYWVVGPDGRVLLAGRGNPGRAADLKSLDSTVEHMVESRSDLIQRIPYYLSGEFLAFSPLLSDVSCDGIPKADLDRIRGKLLSPWDDVSTEARIQSFKDVLAAGGEIEKTHPSVPGLALVRSWMLIAAKWLAFQTHDKAFETQALGIAGRISGASPQGVPAYFADYAATSAKLDAVNAGSDEGGKLISDYLAGYGSGKTGQDAKIFAVMLALENGQDDIRTQLVKQLLTANAAQPEPVLTGFLRGCCSQNADRGVVFHAKLTGMDGRTLTLPDDLAGKVVILQFWSFAHPPQSLVSNLRSGKFSVYTGLGSIPSKGVVVVGINLDKDRTAVEAFLKEHNYPDWVHTFSGVGWDDPVAREHDILALPQTIVLDRDGKIMTDGRFDLPAQIEQAVITPAASPTPNPSP